MLMRFYRTLGLVLSLESIEWLELLPLEYLKKVKANVNRGENDQQNKHAPVRAEIIAAAQIGPSFFAPRLLEKRIFA
jgi:hypothetical protein